jgi:hypothetical protein
MRKAVFNEGLRWCTGFTPAGAHVYVHLIRGVDDMERRARYKGQDKAPHLTAKKTSQETWERLLLAVLSDGEPRTFNAICLELTEKTADVMFSTPLNDALWRLCELWQIECTMVSPIYWRLHKPAKGWKPWASSHKGTGICTCKGDAHYKKGSQLRCKVCVPRAA